MDNRFEEYLQKGTRVIIDGYSSPDISEEERNTIASVYADALANGIGDPGALKDCDATIYTASVQYIDAKLSQLLATPKASYSDYEAGLTLCARQQSLIQLFRDKNWSLPKINNTNLEKCYSELSARQESTSIADKIVDEDQKIDELVGAAKDILSVKICDQVMSLANELEQDIAISKKKRIPLPAINNKDTKKVKKTISEVRKIAEQKEAAHQAIYSVDSQIHSIVSTFPSSSDKWPNLISLCQTQTEQLEKCSKKRWPVPTIRYEKPDEVARRFKHYIEMTTIDNAISGERYALSSNRQYRAFFGNCEKQERNISVCVQNGWPMPAIKYTEPGKIKNEVLGDKAKRDKKKRIRRNLVLTLLGLVIISGLVLYGVYKSRVGKTEIPFDSSYVAGQKLDTILNELNSAGFENITQRPDDSGWLESQSVIRVTIDNSDSFSKGSYKEPSVSVVITYSSDGRIYITDMLSNWNSREYTDVEQTMREAGFTNITLNAVATSDRNRDKQTASISLNGAEYTNEHCYLPLNAPVVISYYSLQIGIGNDSSQWIGLDYEEVVASLEQSGFTNVQTQAVTTGWARENSVVGVTVNNVETYSSSEVFAPDVKIVVKYSSGNRVDVSDLVRNWQSTNYEELVRSLKGKGFTTVKVTTKTTTTKSKNGLVASVSFDNEEYIAGDCYLPTSASIRIEYYVLQITIGTSANDFEDNEQYTDVVARLRSMGFTNIRLQRANDLVTGWVDKEGTIDSISINGNRVFSASDKFQYDDEIVIVVHTFKKKGCEDITEIAN